MCDLKAVTFPDYYMPGGSKLFVHWFFHHLCCSLQSKNILGLTWWILRSMTSLCMIKYCHMLSQPFVWSVLIWFQQVGFLYWPKNINFMFPSLPISNNMNTTASINWILCYLTSLFDANFSQAVTHNSIASVFISSFMSECCKIINISVFIHWMVHLRHLNFVICCPKGIWLPINEHYSAISNTLKRRDSRVCAECSCLSQVSYCALPFEVLQIQKSLFITDVLNYSSIF